MPTSASSDSVSFAVLSFNQSAFITEAVQSALAQDCCNLEIIISDDCSSDNTFEIASALVRQYRGPHVVVLNRNSRNLGIADHVSRVFSLAKGELVILAAGDDISSQNRVSAICNAWRNVSKRAHFVYSGYDVIDSAGAFISDSGWELSWANDGSVCEYAVNPLDFYSDDRPYVFGCASAWSKDVMRVFGDLPSYLRLEDEVLAFRAACLGSFVRIAVPLVKYRFHGANVSAADKRRHRSASSFRIAEEQHRRLTHYRHGMHLARLKDLDTAVKLNLIEPRVYDECLRRCSEEAEGLRLEAQFYSLGFLKRLLLLPSVARHRVARRHLRHLASRCLPDPIFYRLKERVLRLRKKGPSRPQS